MFQQLDLVCFRQHEALTINFQPGVVALRGANEAGKSTILQAIAYALFGARALNEALDDVVTWGRKVSELKVKLDFQLSGVDYRIRRGKSGAEIRNADRILATGQDEVSGYVENLLGASRDVTTKLMLANQEDIKGALSKPGAAVELIEALSNLGVIDTIISLVQEQLPSGRTQTLESRIATLEGQLAVPLVDDTPPLIQAHGAAVEAESQATGRMREAKARYDALQPAAVAAQKTVDDLAKAGAEETRLKADHERAKVTLQALKVPPLPTNIPELRKRVEDAGFMQRAIAAATAMGSVPETPARVWEGDMDSLLAEITKTRTSARAHQEAAANYRTSIARLEAQKITQTACGLCGKDLRKVPEVVTKNAELDAQIEELEAKRQDALSHGESDTTILNAYEAIRAAHTEFMRTYQRAAEFVTLDDSQVPPKWEWSGPEELAEADTDAAAALRAAEAAEREHHAAMGRQQQLQAEVERLDHARQAAEAVTAHLRELQPQAQQVLGEAADALTALSGAQEELRMATEATRSAAQALELAVAVLRAGQASQRRLEADLKAVRDEMAETSDNNALIAFLREARVSVTDQLWSVVMSTVSSYFSDIRGTPSLVSRADNGFKVDGRNVAGLSGSTKDALGLAIRKAMVKHFLPNCPFMMLDEPAAACDDERETNMLGLIASGGFDQVILITHSDLADSFANQVVQL